MAMIVEKRAIKLGYKDDKPTVYKMAAVRQQKVTYDKLLDEVSYSCGVNRSQSKAVECPLVDDRAHAPKKQRHDERGKAISKCNLEAPKSLAWG